MQVMENLVRQYKNEICDFQRQLDMEKERKRDLDQDQGWSREREDLIAELTALRQTVEKTRSEAEKEVKESQVEVAHLRNINRMLEEEMATLRGQLSQGQVIQIRQTSELERALENERDAQAKSERML